MPYFRKLPSGLWQATVRKPDGKKITNTAKLKSVVKDWATKQEAKFKSGDRRDPRAGEIKLGEWRERLRANSPLEDPTLAKQDSIWRTHLEEAWGSWPMNAITKTEAQQWVNRLTVTRVARHQGRDVVDEEAPFLSAATVHEIVNTVGALYVAALDEDPPLVGSNPFAKLKLPRKVLPPIRFYEPDEADALYCTLGDMFGLQARTLVELGMDVGLRPGENYGLHVDKVDWLRGLIDVQQVMTRYGLRDYPKSKKSHRTVPVPPATLASMKQLMDGRTAWGKCTCPKALPGGRKVPAAGPCPTLMFPASKGGPFDDNNFRQRYWNPAVEASRLCGKLSPSRGERDTLWTVGQCGTDVCDDPAHKIHRYSPSVMRHTAASWLVQAAVPLYDVQALLGHESFATTERYAHLAPEAHGKIVDVWKRRTAGAEKSRSGAPVAHESKEPRSS